MEERRLTPVTYHELSQYPDDLTRRELIDGEVHVSPAPSPTHQDVVANLLVLARVFTQQRGLGRVWPAPLDVILSTIDVVQPDLVFLSHDRWHLLTERGIEGAPDLCVEVNSKGSVSRDRMTKRALYARYGVLEYWIVDPRHRTIELLGLTQRASGRRPQRTFSAIASSTVLKGLTLDPAAVFLPSLR